MKVSDFDYELPRECIAQEPARPRDSARLFVHDIEHDRSEHRSVGELDAVLGPGDLLVVNDTRVRSVRLLGRRPTGGAVELLLIEEGQAGRWRSLVKPASRVKAGERIELENGALEAIPIERSGEGWWLELRAAAQGGTVDELIERTGRMPLPPYIRRTRGDERERDLGDYQTLFAREPGAVAAPTAGLHFTPELVSRLGGAGIDVAPVTLHVGEGTFRPVSADDTEQHEMHVERYTLPPATVERIERAQADGGRVVAVGTTSLRVLESCADASGKLQPGSGATDLFLVPGSRFKVVDALLTNFHLPRSTLLMLVAAFAGLERIQRLYAEAIEARYRFYSYGDAMLLQRRMPEAE